MITLSLRSVNSVCAIVRDSGIRHGTNQVGTARPARESSRPDGLTYGRRHTSNLEPSSARRPGLPRHSRQRLDAQDSGGEALADNTSPVRPELHTDQLVMAQPRRALVCRADHEKLRRCTRTSVRQLYADTRAWIDTWMTTLGSTYGPRPPTKSWPASATIAAELILNTLGDRSRIGCCGELAGGTVRPALIEVHVLRDLLFGGER